MHLKDYAFDYHFFLSISVIFDALVLENFNKF